MAYVGCHLQRVALLDEYGINLCPEGEVNVDKIIDVELTLPSRLLEVHQFLSGMIVKFLSRCAWLSGEICRSEWFVLDWLAGTGENHMWQGQLSPLTRICRKVDRMFTYLEELQKWTMRRRK
jgi:hypothetical protein